VSKEDPTKIVLQTNVKADRDPTIQRMSGVTREGNKSFDVPFMSHIEGNLYQGGCQNGLILPLYVKHVISLYKWEQYTIKSDLKSYMVVEMFDSQDQGFEQVEAIADWVALCMKDGPTLVHCQAGLNRSSLIAARAMMKLGKTADEAISLLRSRRSDACLANESFERYLRSL